MIEYRVIRSKVARKLRVRIVPEGVEVIQPLSRNNEEVSRFLTANGRWVLDQMNRAEQLRLIRRTVTYPAGEILFRGQPTRVRVKTIASRSAGNMVRLIGRDIVLSRGPSSRTPLSRSLENWLRREARCGITSQLESVSMRLGQRPARIYVMGQRTKWGNCSSRRNLSFNWRLVLAPEYVLRYLVTHEMVHLTVPDHSAKFWLTVQSLCPETERARQWLCSNKDRLTAPLHEIVPA